MSEAKPPMELRRRVPARTKTLKALWCKRKFMRYGPFRKVRERARLKLYTCCHWCRRPFGDGDMLALAGTKTSGNKLLCQACADELMRSVAVRP